MQPIAADSIIFDLDGTLWDASASCTIAWNETLKQSGHNVPVLTEETIRSFSGLKIETIFENHFSHLPKESHGAILDLFKQQEAANMRKWGGLLYPQVKATLGRLRETYKLFIVSNCLAGYIENFLEFTQLAGVFADFECSGNTNLPKSRNIQLVIERNKLVAPVYIGDTIWDYEASQLNKIPFIYAAYGFGRVEESVPVIQGFEKLPALIVPW